MLGRDPLIPPKRLLRYGRREFVGTGEAYLGHLLDLAGLQPGHRVLDIGCGLGRIARPVVRYLDPGKGSYEGFDVDRTTIGWCRRAYARRHRNARFVRSDVFHPRNHPGGAHGAGDYRFPYADGAFDLVIASSIYPHMLEAETVHYLAESARVLAPAGRLFATFFVLDDVSRARMAAGEAALQFLEPAEHVAVLSEDLPEEGVAYDAAWLAARLVEGGCTFDSLTPGSWRGLEDTRDLLDVVVARRA